MLRLDCRHAQIDASLQALTLFLVWDSESEVTKEGTLLEMNFKVKDEDSESEAERHRKKRKSRTSSEEPLNSYAFINLHDFV